MDFPFDKTVSLRLAILHEYLPYASESFSILETPEVHGAKLFSRQNHSVDYQVTT